MIAVSVLGRVRISGHASSRFYERLGEHPRPDRATRRERLRALIARAAFVRKAVHDGQDRFHLEVDGWTFILAPVHHPRRPFALVTCTRTTEAVRGATP